jgi:hypothetical protein
MPVFSYSLPIRNGPERLGFRSGPSKEAYVKSDATIAVTSLVVGSTW